MGRRARPDKNPRTLPMRRTNLQTASAAATSLTSPPTSEATPRPAGLAFPPIRWLAQPNRDEYRKSN